MHDKTGSGTMTSLTSAVVLPGRGYPVDGPLLFFAQVALRRRGIDVTAIRWSPPPDLDAARAPDWVAGQLEPALAAGGRPLVVATPLGSFAAPVVAARGLPAIWLTPLLGQETVVAALRAAGPRRCWSAVPPTRCGTVRSPARWAWPCTRCRAPTTRCCCRDRWPPRRRHWAVSRPRWRSSSTRSAYRHRPGRTVRVRPRHPDRHHRRRPRAGSPVAVAEASWWERVGVGSQAR